MKIPELLTKPEFYDTFGLVIFTLLIVVGIWMRLAKNKLPNWVAYLIITRGGVGLLIDGTIVIFT